MVLGFDAPITASDKRQAGAMGVPEPRWLWKGR
jgi:hypothetical protein